MTRIEWLTRRAAGRVLGRVRSELHYTADRDPSKAIMVAGTARSGTTWVGDILAAQDRWRMLFEPFHCEKVEEYSGYNYFQYLRPAAVEPRLQAFCDRLFSGAIRHSWIDREIRNWSSDGRVVKEIRANLLLGWMHRNFPDLPLVLVLRHPCAVVSSRLRLGWATDEDIQPMLEQLDLVADHLGDRMHAIARAHTPAAKHAVIWCIHNLIPLRQLARGGACVVFYEHICQDPQSEISRLFEHTGRVAGPEAFRAALTPSPTSNRSSPVVAGGEMIGAWRRQLSHPEICDVLDIVDRFGLGDLYGSEVLPLLPSGERVSLPC